LEAAQGTGSGAAIHRFDEPTRLSLGMVASPQSSLPFRPARSLQLHQVHPSQLLDGPFTAQNSEVRKFLGPVFAECVAILQELRWKQEIRLNWRVPTIRSSLNIPI
jgi:hypothetical protein